MLSVTLLIFFQIERLKAINHELSDKLESTELQRNAIASEYRGQLAEKEVRPSLILVVKMVCRKMFARSG